MASRLSLDLRRVAALAAAALVFLPAAQAQDPALQRLAEKLRAARDRARTALEARTPERAEGPKDRAALVRLAATPAPELTVARGATLHAFAKALREAGTPLLISPEAAAILEEEAPQFLGTRNPKSVAELLDQLCMPHRRITWVVRKGIAQLVEDPLARDGEAAAIYQKLREAKLGIALTDTSIGDFATYLTQATEVPIYIDPTASEQVEDLEELSWGESSAAEFLSIACHTSGLRWNLRHGAVLVHLPDQQAATLVLHDVRDIRAITGEDLIALLEQVVGPAPGPVQLRLQAQGIVIAQAPEVAQQKLRWALEDLRRHLAERDK